MERPAAAVTWVLADDRPGNANQALAVADALGWPYVTKEIRYGPLARLPNALLGASLAGLSAATRAPLAPPWPELVIGAGRRTAPVARWLKRRQPAAFLVQLMWPGSAQGLDLVAVPAHDDVAAGACACCRSRARPTASPRRASARPRPRWRRVWQACRGPMSPAWSAAAGAACRSRAPTRWRSASGRARLARERGGSVLLTTSRRTGETCAAALARAVGVPRLLHEFAPDRDNPYLGLLGAADAVIVTADSASMCVEACASGRPVFLFAARRRDPGQARPAAPRARGGWLPAPARRALAGTACRRRSIRRPCVAEAIRARLSGRIGAAAPGAVASGLQTA